MNITFSPNIRQLPHLMIVQVENADTHDNVARLYLTPRTYEKGSVADTADALSSQISQHVQEISDRDDIPVFYYASDLDNVLQKALSSSMKGFPRDEIEAFFSGREDAMFSFNSHLPPSNFTIDDYVQHITQDNQAEVAREA